jgi:hypothetical protein
MKVETVHKFEKIVVEFLNRFDGWELEWTGGKFEVYDAKGYTPKGKKCVIEMKFRDKYYETKMLEVKKYNALMELDSDIVKIYFVSDPEGTYMFWLDGIKDFKLEKLMSPKTTLWNSKRVLKDVYLLPEGIASYIHKPIES